jgi:hypothetical protein
MNKRSNSLWKDTIRFITDYKYLFITPNKLLCNELTMLIFFSTLTTKYRGQSKLIIKCFGLKNSAVMFQNMRHHNAQALNTVPKLLTVVISYDDRGSSVSIVSDYRLDD